MVLHKVFKAGKAKPLIARQLGCEVQYVNLVC
jgi:hypothetical protein